MTPGRRRLLLAATGIGAAVIGGTLAWRRLEPAAPGAEPQDARPLLAAATFNDADGQPQPFAQWQDRVLVLNFWATWCAPCVEEMPDLQRVRSAFVGRGVEIVGIGIDSPSNIREFRAKLKLELPLLAAGAGGSELGKALGNVAGVLPFTVLVDRSGRVRQRKIGQIKPPELEAWLQAAL